MRTDLKPCTQVSSPPPLLGSFPRGYPQGHMYPPQHHVFYATERTIRSKGMSCSTFANTQIPFSLFPKSYPTPRPVPQREMDPMSHDNSALYRSVFQIAMLPFRWVWPRQYLPSPRHFFQCDYVTPPPIERWSSRSLSSSWGGLVMTEEVVLCD